MNIEELEAYREKNIVDACSFKEPEKVPIGLDMYGWAFHYAGVKYGDIYKDAQASAKAFCKFFDDVEIDFTLFNNIPTIPVGPFEAIGSDAFLISEDGCFVIHNQANQSFMGPEFYDMLLNHPGGYWGFRDDFIKQRFKVFSLPKEEAYEKIKKAAMEDRVYLDANDICYDYLTNKKGIFPTMGQYYLVPFNFIHDTYRGIKDSLLDLRRRPQQVKAACDLIWDAMKDFNYVAPEDMSKPFPSVCSIIHSEPFLNGKQFEEHALSYFKEAYFPSLEAGKKYFIYSEGHLMSKLEYYKDFPKGSVVLKLDTDDPFEAHKIVGDCATLVCGITTDLLKFGTKEECTDYVKKSFDTFAPGGGFMFSVNQELVAASDAKIDNLLVSYDMAQKLSRR